MTLEELTKSLESGGYTPLAEDEMKKQAADRFAALYNQKRTAAQQNFDATDAALARQTDGLAGRYDKQIKQTLADTERSVSEADRLALSRGMQRSSYNAASRSGIRAGGVSAVSALRDSLLGEQNELEARRTQLAEQLAQTLSGYDIDFASDVRAYVDELRAREYDRAVDAKAYADNIAKSLYEYGVEAEERAPQVIYAAPQTEKKSSGSSGAAQKSAVAALLQSGAKSEKKTAQPAVNNSQIKKSVISKLLGSIKQTKR